MCIRDKLQPPGRQCLRRHLRVRPHRCGKRLCRKISRPASEKQSFRASASPYRENHAYRSVPPPYAGGTLLPLPGSASLWPPETTATILWRGKSFFPNALPNASPVWYNGLDILCPWRIKRQGAWRAIGLGARALGQARGERYCFGKPISLWRRRAGVCCARRRPVPGRARRG